MNQLEKRLIEFSINIRKYIKIENKSITIESDLRQLARSSGSIGANYIEANESLGKKIVY